MGRLITETTLSELNGTLELFDRLGVTREDLARIRGGLHGNDAVTRIARILRCPSPDQYSRWVDCAREPMEGHGTIMVNRTYPMFNLDNESVELYQQDPNKPLYYEEFLEDLQGRKPLNMNVLDFLLANYNRIPESWDRKIEAVHDGYPTFAFAGTIYRSFGYINVPCLQKTVAGWSLALFNTPMTKHIPGNVRSVFPYPIVLGLEHGFNKE